MRMRDGKVEEEGVSGLDALIHQLLCGRSTPPLRTDDVDNPLKIAMKRRRRRRGRSRSTLLLVAHMIVAVWTEHSVEQIGGMDDVDRGEAAALCAGERLRRTKRSLMKSL